MTVSIEKEGPVWTVVHDRLKARNAMDPESARGDLRRDARNSTPTTTPRVAVLLRAPAARSARGGI